MRLYSQLLVCFICIDYFGRNIRHSFDNFSQIRTFSDSLRICHLNLKLLFEIHRFLMSVIITRITDID